MAFLVLAMFGFIALPAMTFSLASICSKAGYPKYVVDVHLALGALFAVAGAGVLLMLGGRPSENALMVALGTHLIGGPIVTASAIWIAIAKWPVREST